jgi:hypothetical protein
MPRVPGQPFDYTIASDSAIRRKFKLELTREIRSLGKPVLKSVRLAAPKRTGKLRRGIKMKIKFDADGPFVRITTGARRKGTRTGFRYGLAIQQDRHYLQKGLNRVPRR